MQISEATSWQTEWDKPSIGLASKDSHLGERVPKGVCISPPQGSHDEQRQEGLKGPAQ